MEAKISPISYFCFIGIGKALRLLTLKENALLIVGANFVSSENTYKSRKKRPLLLRRGLVTGSGEDIEPVGPLTLFERDN
jgi:hypothetical protein